MNEKLTSITISYPKGCNECESCAIVLKTALDTAPDQDGMQQVRISCSYHNPEDGSAAVTVVAGYPGGEKLNEIVLVENITVTCPQMASNNHPSGSAM